MARRRQTEAGGCRGRGGVRPAVGQSRDSQHNHGCWVQEGAPVTLRKSHSKHPGMSVLSTLLTHVAQVCCCLNRAACAAIVVFGLEFADKGALPGITG